VVEVVHFRKVDVSGNHATRLQAIMPGVVPGAAPESWRKESDVSWGVLHGRPAVYRKSYV